ncbi:MAG: cpdA [Verrucomicrobiales bacterium]|nr:cpdA [Verrucomicrobiales bacterium]
MKRFLAVSIALIALCASAIARDKPLATIALLSDTHTMVSTNGQDGVYEQHFERAIAQVNKANVDFVLVAGDLSNGGKPEELREFRKRTKEFKAPVYYVPGNHDVGHKFNSGKTNGTIAVERVKAYERLMGSSFFAKEEHGLRIIGLNTSLLGSGFEREHEQWKFLETELATTNGAPKVVFMHYPLFLTNAMEPGGGYWNVEPEARQRLLKLCKTGVKAVLTGHLHKPLTADFEGILLLGTSPTSFGFPRAAHLEGWTLVTIPQNGPMTFERKRLDEN